MSNHHVRWNSFNDEHHYVDHIYYMIHVRPFGLRVSRPYLYMLGSSSLTWVFRVCNCFAPIVFEHRAYHHVMIGCGRLYVQIQRVQNSCTHGILRLYLMSQAYTYMASEHGDRKVERESYSRYGEHHYVDRIYYMIHVRPFSLRLSRPYLYMLGSSSLTLVFRVCNCFAPVVFERRAYHTRSSRGVLARQTFATVHTQGEHLYLDI